MDPRGGRIPELPVGIDERVDFSGRQLETSFAQGRKRFTRLFDELQPQFFVCDDLTDEQLNRFLRHGARPHAKTRQLAGHVVDAGIRSNVGDWRADFHAGWTGAFEVSAQLWALCVDLRTPRRALDSGVRRFFYEALDLTARGKVKVVTVGLTSTRACRDRTSGALCTTAFVTIPTAARPSPCSSRSRALPAR